MAVLSCGRCGLQIRIQAAFLRIENCPRCLARSATVAPLTLGPHAARAAGWGMRAADRRTGRGERGAPFADRRLPGDDRDV